MNTQVQAKLTNIMKEFSGLMLTNIRLQEKDFKGRRALSLELIFLENGLAKTMILFLDKEITETTDWIDYEKLTK